VTISSTLDGKRKHRSLLIKSCGIALVVLTLTGCRVDVAVDLAIGADGTGELAVTANADAEVVEQAPGLADDLRFDDAVAAGWTVAGPDPTDDGGLTMTLRHPVTSAEEATNLLVSLGPPFVDPRLARAVDGDEITWTLDGRLTLPNGFESFADAGLLAAVGGSPFADELAGASPAETMSVLLRADLPGAVEDTTGERADGGLQWDAPLDGTSVDLATRTVQRPASGGGWARPVAVVALVLLVGWLIAAGLFIAYVVRARQRRAPRTR
jgi:hypothetical protein